MASKELESTDELGFTSIGWVKNWYVRQREYRYQGSEERAEKVDPQHHLLPRYFVTRKNFVLRRICCTIQYQIDQEVCHSDDAMHQSGVALASRSVFSPTIPTKSHKHGNACSHEGNDDIFMPRE